MSINSALTAAMPTINEPRPASAFAAVQAAAPLPDLAALKESASKFSLQISAIKTQINQLEALGYPAPQKLTDTIGEGEQLIAMILQASSLADLDDINAGARLESIGARIRANSKY